MEENKKYSVEELLDKLNSTSDTSADSGSFDILRRRNNIRNSSERMHSSAQQPSQQNAPNSQMPQYRATSQLRQQRPMAQDSTRQNVVGSRYQNMQTNTSENAFRSARPENTVPRQQMRTPIKPRSTPQAMETSRPRYTPAQNEQIQSQAQAQQPRPKPQHAYNFEERPQSRMDNIQSLQNYYNDKSIKPEYTRLRPPVKRKVIARNDSFTYLDDAPQQSERPLNLMETMGERSARLEGINFVEEPTREQELGDTIQTEIPKIDENINNIGDNNNNATKSKIKKIKQLYSSERMKNMSAEDLYADTDMSAESMSAEDSAEMLASMHKSLIIKFVLSIISSVALIYLSASQVVNLLIPTFLVGKTNLIAYIIFGIFILQAIINSSTIGGGLVSLFTLKPDNDAYASIAVFAATMQGAYVVFNPSIMATNPLSVLMPVVSLILVFNILGKLSFTNRLTKSLDIVGRNGKKKYLGITTNTILTNICGDTVRGAYPCVAYVKEADGIDYFVDTGFSDSYVERVSRIFAPLVGIASILSSVIYYFSSKDVFSALTVFASVAVISAPLSAVIASQLPISKLNNSLYKSGSAVAGYDSVEMLSSVNTVLLNSDQLFPTQNIALLDMKPLHGVTLGKLVNDVTACLSPFKSNFTRLFDELGAEHIYQIEEAKYQDSQGYTAWVAGKRIQVGTREFMESYNVSLPHINLERDYNKNSNELIYVANSGVVTGILVISHTANKAMKEALDILCDKGVSLLVMSDDPTLTPERIGNLYKYPPELIKIVPDAEKEEFNENIMPQKISGSTVAFENTADAIRSVFLANDCRKLSYFTSILIAISIVVGFGIAVTFTMLKQILTLSWFTIVAYQAVWLIVVLLVVSIWRTRQE